MTDNGFNIIIAGGKTGGHLFPGIAVAEALKRLRRDVDILFVGTTAPLEVQTLNTYGYAHRSIFSKPIKGGNILSKGLSICILLISLIQSMVIMKTVKPDFVLGVGGFSSFAVVIAAWIFRIPTAIQEQNAFPGLTNRLLSRFACTIFTAFKETKGFETNPKVQYVGNPVRKTNTAQSNDSPTRKLIDPDKFTLLVTGGSQGAASINTAFMEAVSLLDDPDQFNIIHQTGIQDELGIQKKYNDLQIKAVAKAFFHDMPLIQEAADLVITRAGAGIISELCIRGLPAILVPFPHAADDHQTFNAKALEAREAAVMIADHELTGQKLKNALTDLMGNKEKLDHMSRMAAHLAMPDADETIAAVILKTKDMKA